MRLVRGLHFRFWLMCFITLPIGVKAQIPTGLVLLDQNSSPVVGASVNINSRQIGQISNERGIVIFNIDTDVFLTISHVGFKGKEVSLSPGNWQTIILEPLTTELNSVEVEGFLGRTNLSEQAGAISTLNPGQIRAYDPTSLVQSVNSLPGIRFEERAIASYRISIRGSSVRSPFGVRNVKIYWNGIPITEPGGNTFINLLDLTNISSLEVIKGPAGNIYGAGTGGVIKLKSTAIGELQNSIQIANTTGSFGLVKSDLQLNQTNKRSSLTIKAALQKSDGYREHNAMNRKNLEMDALLFTGTHQTISASLFYSNLFYEIPGALNPTQREQNRKQARPGSIEKNASIDNQYWLIKLGQELEWGNGWKSKMSVFSSILDFENPFILDYKRDKQKIYGGRLEADKSLNIVGKDASLIFGAEFQNSAFDGKNFGNVMGHADTINFHDKIDSRESILFASLNLEPLRNLFVTAGISRNTLSYNIDRVVDKVNNNPQRFNKEFETVWSPRVAVSQKLNKDFSVHFSISQGFSPPTTTEVRTNEGSINRAIQPEKGTNYEWNLRGKLFKSRLSLDLAVFRLDLKESISSYTNENGVVLFRNAGQNKQVGFETQLSADWINNPKGAIKRFNTTLAYTIHDFMYENYVNDGDDFSGNALPGTAKNVANLGFHLELNTGISMHLTYHYSDPIPLNDSNNVYSRPYNLWNFKYNYELGLTKKLGLAIFAGVNNLFNVDYSLGNDLNAFGNRYFQPAPERNYLLGLKVKFNYQ